MSDPLSIANLSATALTEGIKFLYEQAGELLRRRRDRAGASPGGTPSALEPAVGLPAPDPVLLMRFEADLRALRSDLDDYITSRSPITASDDYLLRTAEALRRVMEVVYGIPVLLPGESSQITEVSGNISADEVAGYVAAIRTERAEGTLRGTTTVGTVHEGGAAVGVEVRDSRRRR